MRISTPLTSRARKDNTVSQCVTRTRRECRGLIVSAIRGSVPIAYASCTVYPRNSGHNVSQFLVRCVTARSFWLTINATKACTVAFCVIALKKRHGLTRDAQSSSPRANVVFPSCHGHRHRALWLEGNCYRLERWDWNGNSARQIRFTDSGEGFGLQFR